MTDGQSEPSERDIMEVPPRPNLRCLEHGSVCEVVHSLHWRVVELERRVNALVKEDSDG